MNTVHTILIPVDGGAVALFANPRESLEGSESFSEKLGCEDAVCHNGAKASCTCHNACKIPWKGPQSLH